MCHVPPQTSPSVLLQINLNSFCLLSQLRGLLQASNDKRRLVAKVALWKTQTKTRVYTEPQCQQETHFCSRVTICVYLVWIAVVNPISLRWPIVAEMKKKKDSNTKRVESNTE